MLPEIKVYKIDYDFIISNYLDKSLWKKRWNLFVYKDHVFTLNLYSINTKNEEIRFEITYNKRQYSSELIDYNIQNTSIKILKQQINGAMFRLMEREDESMARSSSGYQAVYNAYRDEDFRLREIAESFLDDQGIEIEEVRDAYIERYVYNNAKMSTMLHNYLDGVRYTFLTELLLVFTKVTDDTKRYETVCNAVGNKGNIALIESAVEQFVQEMETDDYEEEMTNALESL